MTSRTDLTIYDPAFTEQDRQYFQSSDFKSLSASARLSVFEQRYAERTRKTPDAAEEALKEEQLRQIYEERHLREQESLKRSREAMEVRNRLIRGW
jgi:hypothetical protein